MGRDWYLPAIDELRSIYTAKEKINVTLERLGKIMSGKFNVYWSSSEEDKFCAWPVLVGISTTLTLNKDGNFYVRAVSAF